MDNPYEFAPQYTLRERWRILLFAAVAGSALFGAAKAWLFPWLHAFSYSAPCRTMRGVNASTVLFYAVFVGIPLQAAVIVVATSGRRGYKILRQGQAPLQGEKIFGRTRIVRGRKAKLIAVLHIVAASPLIRLAIWGSYQIEPLVRQLDKVPEPGAVNALLSDTLQPAGIPGNDPASSINKTAGRDRRTGILSSPKA